MSKFGKINKYLETILINNHVVSVGMLHGHTVHNNVMREYRIEFTFKSLLSLSKSECLASKQSIRDSILRLF